MCCGNTCTKYLMFLFNFIFALGGIALLVVGALTQAQISEASKFLDGKFSGPPIVLIVLGSVIFVIAFFGCCGAGRDNVCMLTTFAVILILLLVTGIAIAIVAFVFKDQISGVATEEITKAIDEYNTSDTAAAQIDAIQTTWQCCGANGPGDYIELTTLPNSCCDKYIANGTCTINLSNNLYRTGCIAKLQEFIKYSGALLGGLALGVALIMIIGIVLSLGLVRSIKRSVSV